MKSVFKISLAIFLCLTFCVEVGLAQLKIDRARELTFTQTSLSELLKASKIDYALVTWSTSPWLSSSHHFYALVQQQGQWYLTKLDSHERGYVQGLDAVSFTQKPISVKGAKKWLRSIDRKSVFSVGQEELNKLPDTCSYTDNHGLRKEIFNISDAATVHLLEFKPGDLKSLKFYAPEYYLNKCFPQVSEFGILQGLVRGRSELLKLMNDEGLY